MSRTVFEKYKGSEEVVTVASCETVEEVTAIAAKAFLSCKTIKKLKIAGSVTEIGDWAFAHMQNLQVLVLPKREVCFGKKVFLGCDKLMRIEVEEDESRNPGTPYFLASAVRVLEKESLWNPACAAGVKSHKTWMKDYDDALLTFLSQEDEKGFDPVFFGWFRVEDIDDQLPSFLAVKRKQKALLVLQRLLYPMYLESETKDILNDYIRAHLPQEKGADADEKAVHTAVYDLFTKRDCDMGKDVRYLQILKENNHINAFLLEKLLRDMEMPSTEVTAFLLKMQAEMTRKRSFFEEFHF